MTITTTLAAGLLLGGCPRPKAEEDTTQPGDDQSGLSALAAPLGPGSITTTELANGAVNTDDLAAGVVTADKLADGTVNAGDLGPDAVTTEKIKDGTVGPADLAAGAVTADKLAPGAVGTEDLAAGSITTDKLADGAVTCAKLAAEVFNCIVVGPLPPGSIATDKLADAAVTSAKIRDGAVTFIKLAADVIAGIVANVPPGSITATHLAADSVGSEQIQAGAVGTAELANDAVTSDKIANGTIQPEDLSFACGDITAALPGAGLTGGGTSGDATLSVGPHAINGDLLSQWVALGGSGAGGDLKLLHSDGVSERVHLGWIPELYGGCGLDFLASDGRRRASIHENAGAGFGGVISVFPYRSDQWAGVEIGSDTAAGGGSVGMYNGATPGKFTFEVRADNGNGGAKLSMFNGQSPNQETIRLEGSGSGGAGVITMLQPDGNRAITVHAYEAGEGNRAAIHMFHPDTDVTTVLLDSKDATYGAGYIDVRDGQGNPTIWLYGATGCIHATTISATQGSCDLAENFEHSEPTVVRPGMVMVLDPASPGKLTLSTQAYDKKVAGIVSGAGGLRPGMVLGGGHEGTQARRHEAEDENQSRDRKGAVAQRDEAPTGVRCDAHSREEPLTHVRGSDSLRGSESAPDDVERIPLALSGRVYCYVDATENGVEVGDLLTTSDTPGYAMKAVDRERAFGAVLGKAMEPLPQGEKGLILVLVSLQ